MSNMSNMSYQGISTGVIRQQNILVSQRNLKISFDQYRSQSPCLPSRACIYCSMFLSSFTMKCSTLGLLVWSTWPLLRRARTPLQYARALRSSARARCHSYVSALLQSRTLLFGLRCSTIQSLSPALASYMPRRAHKHLLPLKTGTMWILLRGKRVMSH